MSHQFYIPEIPEIDYIAENDYNDNFDYPEVEDEYFDYLQEDDDHFDDTDDGEALASAGFGTDEDYGGFDSEF